MKILLTGVAGTGKSTIIRALNEKGIHAIDLHEVPGIFFWKNKITGERIQYSPIQSPEWFNTVERVCDLDLLKKLVDQDENIIMAGTANDYQIEMMKLFDKTVLLQAKPEVLLDRLETRINKSGYGKTKAEQDDNFEWQKEFDPMVLSHGAIPINTEDGLDEVVEKILSLQK